jgi:hypothetical protein
MRLINYDKYEKWSLRSTIALAIVEALVAGFFLGVGVVEAFRGSNLWMWVWNLAMGFSGVVGALLATLVALHKVGSPAASSQNGIASHSVIS